MDCSNKGSRGIGFQGHADASNYAIKQMDLENFGRPGLEWALMYSENLKLFE